MPIKRYQRGIFGTTGVIPAGQTSVLVSHNLGVAPVSYNAHAIGDSLGQDIYAKLPTATTITVAMDAAQVSDVNFSVFCKR